MLSFYHIYSYLTPLSLKYEDIPHYFYSQCQFLLVQYYCRLLMNIQISREITVNNQNQSLIVLLMFRREVGLLCTTYSHQWNGSIYILG